MKAQSSVCRRPKRQSRNRPPAPLQPRSPRPSNSVLRGLRGPQGAQLASEEVQRRLPCTVAALEQAVAVEEAVVAAELELCL